MKHTVCGTAIIITALAIVLWGCNATDPENPVAPHSGELNASLLRQGRDAGQIDGFFPLTVGNSWHYTGTVQTWAVEGDVPSLPYTIQNTIDRELIGTELRSGLRYIVEEERTTQDVRPEETFTYWTRYRQDRLGLYYADIPILEPPNLEGQSKLLSAATAGFLRPLTTYMLPMPQVLSSHHEADWQRAWFRHSDRLQLAHNALSALQNALSSKPPAGPADSEVTLLSYPLHPGASWIIRPEFPLTWTVEGIELLDLPAGRFTAYRIRIDWGNLGPTDQLFIWYGRSGRLAHHIHITTEATDGQGNHIGVFTSDEVETLESLNLEEHR